MGTKETYYIKKIIEQYYKMGIQVAFDTTLKMVEYNNKNWIATSYKLYEIQKVTSSKGFEYEKKKTIIYFNKSPTMILDIINFSKEVDIMYKKYTGG